MIDEEEGLRVRLDEGRPLVEAADQGEGLEVLPQGEEKPPAPLERGLPIRSRFNDLRQTQGERYDVAERLLNPPCVRGAGSPGFRSFSHQEPGRRSYRALEPGLT